MLYWLAVASSIAVIENEASPSMSTTIFSGAATLAPMADGRPKPIVCRVIRSYPRYVSGTHSETTRRYPASRLGPPVVLTCPHLMLSNTGRNDHLVLCILLALYNSGSPTRLTAYDLSLFVELPNNLLGLKL